jgi:hypothetical protein
LVLLLELMPFFVVVAGFLFAVLDSFSFTCNSGVVADNTFSPTEEADKKLVIMAGSVEMVVRFGGLVGCVTNRAFRRFLGAFYAIDTRYTVASIEGDGQVP